MAGLVPAIHAFGATKQGVDAGHDDFLDLAKPHAAA
jgi:hypothetical protein